MLVSVDFGEPVEVLHSVKAIIGDGDELHVTVSAGGVIYDRIGGGEVVRTQCVFADDILPDAASPAGDAEDIDDAVLAIVENAPDWPAEKVLAVKRYADAEQVEGTPDLGMVTGLRG
jgi:hypothetical protein